MNVEPSPLPQHTGTRTVVIRVLDEAHPIECAEPEHAGTRTLVIRVLEVLKPIELLNPSYNGGIPPPRVVELLISKIGRGFGVKSFDLDGDGVKTSIVTLLRFLWDSDVENAVLPSSNPAPSS